MKTYDVNVTRKRRFVAFEGKAKNATWRARGRQNKLHGDRNLKSNCSSTIHPTLFISVEKFYS